MKGKQSMNAPSYDFSKKAAVVTGAGGGMGEAVALALANSGALVTAIDVKPCPESLAALERSVSYAQGDLRDEAFVEETIAGSFARNGQLDYLVNVAGVLWFGRDKSLLDMDLSVWDEVVDINLKSMVLTSRAAVPFMRRTGSGAMVHVSTIQWMRGDLKPQDAYQASKAAVCAVSRSLAMQLAADHAPRRHPLLQLCFIDHVASLAGQTAGLQRCVTMRTSLSMSNTLPILPMRAGVLFPGMSLPISAARPQTLRAIEAALRDPEHRVLVLAQRDDQDEVTP